MYMLNLEKLDQQQETYVSINPLHPPFYCKFVTVPYLPEALVLLSSHHSHDSIVYSCSGEWHAQGTCQRLLLKLAADIDGAMSVAADIDGTMSVAADNGTMSVAADNGTMSVTTDIDGTINECSS